MRENCAKAKSVTKSFFSSGEKSITKILRVFRGEKRHKGSINNSSLFLREVRRHARRIGQMNTFRGKRKKYEQRRHMGSMGLSSLLGGLEIFITPTPPKNPRCPAGMGRPTSLPKPITHLVFSLVERYREISRLLCLFFFFGVFL